ncbi:glycosyltransferase family 90 protein [Dothistroma septosporum NZE10]|uniref:Glycosyltransferase family 90 protein n=1 Tax=Dothistroma septosporum (strain NZE10 / CBS 128990) TaxID=675120 RepID=N1PHH1_DOTSN|nr:glycosyltransferase family 90 protein [Dothistroma septosporum NZE10]
MACITRRALGVLLLSVLLSGALLIGLFTHSVTILQTPSFSAKEEERPPIDPSQHPILVLAERAEAAFHELLARQSETYEEAVTEYRRRYQRSPPPGFKHWYSYAVAEKSPIIDDFDVLDAAITPFLSHSGATIQEQIASARESDSATWECTIHNRRLGAGCERLSEPILRLFADARILPYLPDVAMLFNALDEPRVLLQQRNISRALHSASAVEFTDFDRHDVWDLAVKAQCQQQRDAGLRKGSGDRRDLMESFGLSLVQDNFEVVDVCRHPEYRGLHAFFTSPGNWRATKAAVPILSPAVVSTMGDIPYPAAAYNSGGYKFEESDAVKWDRKTNALYWAGKTTGGLQKGEDEWKQFHRHRFVSLTNDMEPRPFTYLQRDEDGGDWRRVEREDLNTTSYHTYFTDVVQCDKEACNSVREYFDIHEGDPPGETSKYTLNFDSDGNGHSGRYYRLLASYSLPLKSTVFREWHDDRLQPWLHYVPISLGMDELPEVVRYLVEEEEGRELAERLAMKGRQWTLKALRPVDQVVYLYRMMLELARAQDPKRPALRVMSS